ncbi:MAG TPA: PqqD family protein [Gaiellaceae bacterium]|nr:PqqD family protein [Gaiellaceae bacterium]
MNSDFTVPGDAGLRIPAHVLSRRAGDETVLLNLENEQYYGLDGVGTRLWELVEAGTTVAAAVANLGSEYSVERGVLEGDVKALIADLSQNGLIVVDAP